MSVTGKRVLKKVAEDWCKAILMANEASTFNDEFFTPEEQYYIIEQCEKIAEKITPRETLASIQLIAERHYDFETE